MTKTKCELTDSLSSAKAYALKLLSYRGRSEKELTARLLGKSFPESSVINIVRYLKRIGLIDDMILAQSLKREALSNKLLSLRSAKQYIQRKGISSDIIEQIFAHAEPVDYKNAQKLFEKRIRSLKNYPPDVQRRRIYASLVRKGFSYDIIKTILQNNFT